MSKQKLKNTTELKCIIESLNRPNFVKLVSYATGLKAGQNISHKLGRLIPF